MDFPPSPFVVSIHSNENAPVTLTDILQTLGKERIESLIWGIREVDCTGEMAQDLVADLNTPNNGILVRGNRLFILAEECEQIIEGIFVGYPSDAAAAEFLDSSWQLASFAFSASVVAVEVTDGDILDIYLRSEEDVENLQHSFSNIHIQDLANFLEPWMKRKLE